MNNKETLSISIADLLKLGITWQDWCRESDANPYALMEGLSEETILTVPVKFIKENIAKD